MKCAAHRLGAVALGAVLGLGCGPEPGDAADPQWVVGAWYHDVGCRSFPCGHFPPGLTIATVEFDASGAVGTEAVALCADYPATQGVWEAGAGTAVRVEPIEESTLRWAGAAGLDWVEVRRVDDCTFESELSDGNFYTYRRGVVAIEPTPYSCEGKIVAADAEATSCLGPS